VRLTVALALLASSCGVQAADYLDLAPSGRLAIWSGNEPRRLAAVADASGSSNVGIEWDEERDIREIKVRYASEPAKGVRVQYWFRNWPYDPPRMPSFEDPMDDPWQGQWLTAAASETCERSECRYDFSPLEEAENSRAKNLPGVGYRRTLKVRLAFAGRAPAIAAISAFSDSVERPRRVRVETEFDTEPAISVYNGRLRSATPSDSPKGLTLDLVQATPSLPGSHDLTVVTVKTRARTYSFCIDDLKHGPIVIPDFGVKVVDLDQPNAAAGTRKLRIRQRIPNEPEQTYERAVREIPPLDPWQREWGGRVYLPLAPDSDWQKFAFEYGGNVFVSKSGIKAKGHELGRLQWTGDKITWTIATGESRYQREDHKVTVSKLDGYLPVVTQGWQNDGLDYSEEAFSTLLRGPLSPEDPARSEQTPAILMLRVAAHSVAEGTRTAHVWVSVDPIEELSLDGNFVTGNGLVRAHLHGPAGATMAAEAHGIHIQFPVPPGAESSVVIKLPCVSDLTAADRKDLEALRYSAERDRVIAYWRQIVEPAVRFTVPEPKFNLLARTVVAQIHISTTKDPRTGLYIVPAASYVYDVFENEACYQVLLLDTLGQFQTATRYLETMMRLQGSKNFPGAQQGPTHAIFHGAKIDDVYDYTAHGYGLDHPTVLWTLAQHYFYTRDRQWLEHAWPHMRKAIDWIVTQRSTTKQNDVDGQKLREYGLLPASQLEDNADWANWFSINAYAWAGMRETAEALEETGNPEASRIRKEADEFRTDLRGAILRSVGTAPVVRMQDGTYEPYAPVVPTRRFRIFGPIRMDYYNRYGQQRQKPLMRLGADRDTLCGAVVWLILGLFSPDEPIANWILDDWEDNETLSSGMGLNIHGMTDDNYWFSQGGMVFQANLLNPIAVYLWRHEVPAAIRNLYNDFVSCLYPEVNMFTEEYHQWRHGSGPFYKISDESRFVNRVRDTLVLEEGDTLWLGLGVPRRWLESAEGIRVDRVQTFFGPVSYTMHAGLAPGTVEATVQLPSGHAAKKNWLVARVPSGHIERVRIDGKLWTRIDRGKDAIELPSESGTMHVEIEYR
jgi:hypothetical protein